MNKGKTNRLIGPWILLAFAIVLLLSGLFQYQDPAAVPAPVQSPGEALNVFAPSIGLLEPSTTPPPTQAPTFTPSPTPAPSTTPFPLLQAGMNGEAVRAMQEELIALEYLATGKADGEFGAGTREAVVAFQKGNGLDADGIAGDRTLSLLFGGHATKSDDPFVWIEKGGDVYHSTPECSGMKEPYQVKLSQATKAGLKPCELCH